MGIPWDRMGWDRHELLWNGMGWDRKICPMDKPVYLRAIFSTFSFSLPAVKLSGIRYFFIASVGLFIEN